MEPRPPVERLICASCGAPLPETSVIANGETITACPYCGATNRITQTAHGLIAQLAASTQAVAGTNRRVADEMKLTRLNGERPALMQRKVALEQHAYDARKDALGKRIMLVAVAAIAVLFALADPEWLIPALGIAALLIVLAFVLFRMPNTAELQQTRARLVQLDLEADEIRQRLRLHQS